MPRRIREQGKCPEGLGKGVGRVRLG